MPVSIMTKDIVVWDCNFLLSNIVTQPRLYNADNIRKIVSFNCIIMILAILITLSSPELAALSKPLCTFFQSKLMSVDRRLQKFIREYLLCRKAFLESGCWFESHHVIGNFLS